MVPLSEEHRFHFDLRGWVCIPGVLSEGETATARDHMVRLTEDRDSLDSIDRHQIGGPIQNLIDHPVLV